MKFHIIWRKDEEHVGRGHLRSHLNGALYIDVEHDELAIFQCTFDGCFRCAICMAPEHFGEFEKIMILSIN